MIKLVVSDFDGTLLQYGKKELDPLIIKRIRALLDSGCFFAVASGRIESELVHYLSDLSDRIYFISSDGALVTYRNKVLFQSQFSNAALTSALGCVDVEKGYIRLFSQKGVYTTKKTDEFPDDIYIQKPHEIKEPIHKIISYNTSLYAFENSFARSHYSESGINEYVSRFANKGVALGALQRHLGVNLYETLAMGDRNNDIPMMKNAKYRVAVGNRSDELKLVCDIQSDNSLEILQKVWLGSDF